MLSFAETNWFAESESVVSDAAVEYSSKEANVGKTCK